MERSGSTRKRRQGPGQPAKPPVRLSREKRRQQDGEKTRAAKASDESSRGAAKPDASERASVEEDPNARSFTVGNVGRNGTLYLKPSRITPPQFKQQSTKSPLKSSSFPQDIEYAGTSAAGRRDTGSIGTVTPKYPFKLRSSAFNATAPLPLPMERGRVRSHSFSTIEEAANRPTLESAEFQVLLNGHETRKRSQSSVDLSRGLLSFQIPHYRLGTPRFSDLGTAYLHHSLASSMATRSITEDMRSSNTSKPDYNRFPAPPGRDLGLSFAASQRSNTSFLHPSQAGSLLTPTRTPTQSAPRGGGGINVAMYDHVEANINSPSLVRYSPATGRIMAATPARLVAQITSPWFLDYDLLSDFFLTYRNFLSRHDLLNYLLVRMKWALANDSDSGRIVTVRTFVALRHWILNYFADDFIPDPSLRQRLCDLVNEIAEALRQRADRGGGNMNVIGELKKCWRRICAMFWSVEDLSETAPDADIVPGEGDRSSRVRASATSMVQSAPHEGNHMDFRRSSVIPLPVLAENAEVGPLPQTPHENGAAQSVQMTNIPTSPASTQSLHVLSCSVPFLKNIVPIKDRSAGPHPLEPPKESSENSASTAKRHQRSASFTDAWRDDRAPLSSGQPESVDFRSLPHMSFTGGLVRGLLLQPSPSKVDLVIPLSPPLDNQDFDFGFGNTDASKSIHDSQQSSAGVKKIVGDVRRALSGRKRDSPTSSYQSTSSSESRHSGSSAHNDRNERTMSFQRLQGPPRIDMLGERIQSTYGEALQELVNGGGAYPTSGTSTAQRGNHVGEGDLLPPQVGKRWNTSSHVTTGSRSIVIVDDTWVPEVPAVAAAPLSQTTPSVATTRGPGYINSDEAQFTQTARFLSGKDSSLAAATENEQRHSSEAAMHDLLAVPEPWQGGIAISDDVLDVGDVRKSSSAHPGTFDMPPIHHQLRRRPGGDLKTADRVHDLEYAPRPPTADSSSAFSQAIFTSGIPSAEFSGTHYSVHENNGLAIPQSFFQGMQKDSWTLLPTYSSQPNMRASMKAQVSHLAKLPDEASDGGVEDTLAKLEGKTASPTASTHAIAEREGELDSPRGPLQVTNRGTSGNDPSADEARQSALTDRRGGSIDQTSGAHVGSTAVSRPPRDIIPPRTSSKKQGRDVPVQDTHLSSSGEEAVVPGNINGDRLMSSGTQKSFLLDDDENLSDISSEMEDDPPVEDSLAVRSFYFDDTQDQTTKPRAHFREQPSPTTTFGAPGSPSTHRRTISEPKQSPRVAPSASMVMVSNHQNRRSHQVSTEPMRSNVPPLLRHNAHLPFVLGWESDVIAEQLTIIEKDALDEIDWKDLIALNWQHAPLHIRNWVDFLKRDDCNGIDIVVSRFNLVVKWVVSECVLTDLPTERARCISKYIHVAAHARRLRNYATMYQITLALLSSDMARLRKTWTLVPAAEKTILARLEKLCNPRGNFQHLRLEMESASVDEACIPFIGLYTHDLMFNAQKPSRIESTLPKGEPLINFERFQSAATLVKSLLTLIEASSKYVFRPRPELLSRCLWLAALEDNEITARSKILE